MPSDKTSFLNPQANWKEIYFYQKSDVLYQMTYSFCDRFVPLVGDRTRDQMIQAARSGKQNIVEGLADGVTSVEMMIKLINVARASFAELCQDYLDYSKAHGLSIWDNKNVRYDGLLSFCRAHNRLDEYTPFFDIWSAEEYCNTAITLCRMVDRMITNFLKKEEQKFIENGGIKERMHKARTNYRTEQDEELARLRQELPAVKDENSRLKNEILRLQTILKNHSIPF